MGVPIEIAATLGEKYKSNFATLLNEDPVELIGGGTNPTLLPLNKLPYIQMS